MRFQYEKKLVFGTPKIVVFLHHFWSTFGSAFRGHMTTSWHCFGRSKRSKVLILPVRGAENHPPGKAPQDTSKASLFGPCWGAQAAPWGTKKGPKKWPGTGGKFTKKSSLVGPQRVPQGPCLGRAGRARPGRPRGRPGRRPWPGPGPGRPAGALGHPLRTYLG